MKKIFFVMCVFVLTGCAATDQIVKSYDASGKVSQKENLLLEPIDAFGLLETPALLAHKATFYEVIFPDMLYIGEIAPTRLKWFGRVITGSKKEYQAQLLIPTRVNRKGHIVGILEVDATDEELKDARAIVLATRFSSVFNLQENEKEIMIERSRYTDDQKYRQDLIWENGVRLRSLAMADYMWDVINKWNRYETKRGFILSPGGVKEFKEALAMNPKYTFSQRLVEAHLTISPDLYGTAMANFISLAETYKLAPTSWCFDGLETRRNIAVAAMSLIKIKQEIIDELKQTNDILHHLSKKGE